MQAGERDARELRGSGKVFVEYLSPLKRTRIKTRMLKKSRDEARV